MLRPEMGAVRPWEMSRFTPNELDDINEMIDDEIKAAEDAARDAKRSDRKSSRRARAGR